MRLHITEMNVGPLIISVNAHSLARPETQLPNAETERQSRHRALLLHGYLDLMAQGCPLGQKAVLPWVMRAVLVRFEILLNSASIAANHHCVLTYSCPKMVSRRSQRNVMFLFLELRQDYDLVWPRPALQSTYR